MKYTKDNIQGIICLYSFSRNGKYDSKEYLVDCNNVFKNSVSNHMDMKISWSSNSIAYALNNGQFKEIRNLNQIHYEIY